jgi:hypothetical protein
MGTLTNLSACSLNWDTASAMERGGRVRIGRATGKRTIMPVY